MLDKDTWLAQNLFPKNTTDRKPRNNVTSVEVFNATRKTTFTICVLGSWAIYMPPYNIARLSSLLREAGYLTRVHDFNVDSHYAIKEANPDLEDAWNGANYWWWQGDEYFKRIHPTYEPILKQYLEVIIAEDSDIVGFSTYYTNLRATIWMIAELRKRKPNITIVMGGPECHERYFKKPDGVDYYFVGESEQNILDFLGNWEQGIKPLVPAIGSLYSDTRIDIDSLPYPDYDDFDLSKYWAKNSICAELSRGCIAKCNYCTEVYYWKFRDRGALTVVDELEYQVKKYGVSFVSFVDSLMNGNLKGFRQVCEEIVKRDLKINWWGYARCDGRMDLEYYQLMKASGGQGFNYGIESGSDKVLTIINKKNTVAEINQNLIDSESVGMKVSACWVIGAPGEDIEAFTHSFNMLWNHRARIYACSPGPGLGDNFGSDYDNREKHNLNPRAKPWLGAWYTLDLLNTKLHRHIRIKLMHIWLHICREYGGTITNVHSSEGDITDHFQLKFDSEYINEEVAYENFDFMSIIKSDQGAFADSVMNEVFGFFRMLWRVRGGFEMTMNFNPELDHRDFIFAIAPDTHSYVADLYFKIDDDGNFSTKCNFKFVNNYKDVVALDGFSYTFEDSGKWIESTKTFVKKIFYIKNESTPNVLPLESCFSSMSVPERFMLLRTSKQLAPGSNVLEINASLGGRSVILARGNKNINIHSIETFNEGSLLSEFGTVQSWIREQLFDMCNDNNLDRKVGQDLLEGLIQDFVNDPTGEAAWSRITGKYPYITLHKKSSHQEFADWDLPLDLVLINIRNNPLLVETLMFWSSHLKSNGRIMTRLYDAVSAPDVFNEINRLIEQGWKAIDKEDNMILIQKP